MCRRGFGVMCGTPAATACYADWPESSLHMPNIKRGVHVVVVVVAVTFVGASAAQIIPAVFGVNVQPVPSEPAGSPERECAEGVRSLAVAVDRASQEAWSAGAANARTAMSAGPPLEAFLAALAPEWNATESIEQACGRAREGSDAWAALMRLRRAEEQVVLGSLVELVPLRRDVAAHLPPNLR